MKFGNFQQVHDTHRFTKFAQIQTMFVTPLLICLCRVAFLPMYTFTCYELAKLCVCDLRTNILLQKHEILLKIIPKKTNPSSYPTAVTILNGI